MGALGCLGIGAGLDPRLKPGTVVMATEVLDSGMSQEPLRFDTDRNLGKRIKRCLEAGGLPVFRGSLWTGPSAVRSTRDKADLFTRSGALAADLESGEIARQTSAIGLPCFILRTVCDPADHEVPGQMTKMLNQTGSVNPTALALHVVRKPTLLLEMVILTRYYRAALTALHRVWALTATCLI